MIYDIPPPRPLSRDDKKYDRLRFNAWGKSILDYATKLADPHRIRAQNPPLDRGDTAALRIIAAHDRVEREAKISHLKEHGSCSSRVRASTGALPDPGSIAPGETEVVDPRRETFADVQYPGGRSETDPPRPPVERRPVIVMARTAWRRAYRHWSDSWARTEEAKPLPGSHLAPVDPWSDLVAQSKRWLLRKQDERQCWAQFVDTGDEDVRQRLINSCASKCLFHARKTRRQDRWDAFMTLRDEVGRIIDRRDFDPDLASLPTFVGRLLALRVKDVERGIRTRAKLFDQISLREPPAGGEDDDSAAEIAEAVGVIDAEVDRVERLLASLADEVDRQIVRLALEGQTQGAIALALGVTQQAVGKRFKKIGRSGC